MHPSTHPLIHSSRKPSTDALQECFGIWNRFLEYLIHCKENGQATIAEKYRGGLIPFAMELAKKISFVENGSELSTIEDELENSQVSHCVLWW